MGLLVYPQPLVVRGHRRGIVLYLDDQSVCPFVQIDFIAAAPSPPSECVSPLLGTIRGGGRGGQFGRHQIRRKYFHGL
jgi:hypothetical protein